MHHVDFAGRNVIITDENIGRIVGNRYHRGSSLHSLTLYIINGTVNVLARTVNFGGVNVHNQWFFKRSRQCNRRREGYPVMSMNHVELCVFIYPFNKIAVIAPRLARAEYTYWMKPLIVITVRIGQLIRHRPENHVFQALAR